MKSKTRRHRGFVLAEIVIVLAIIGLMAGAIGLGVAGRRDDSSEVRAEAESLAQWLTHKMTRARAEGVGFKIIASLNSGSGSYEILVARSAAKPGKAEIYRARGAKLAIYNNRPVYIYNKDWHTLTPAMTVYVKSRTRPGEVIYAVTVSGYGFISVSRQTGTSSLGAEYNI